MWHAQLGILGQGGTMSHSRLRTWIKRVALGAGILVLLAAAGFAWMINRPRTCAIEAPGRTGQRVAGSGQFANYFPAATGRRGPAVLVIGGSEGGLSREAKREALDLQAAGFSVLQVAYHCAPGVQNSLIRVPLETFDRALDWLKRRPEVDPNALGVVGYSKGAEAALLVASRRPDVRAVAPGMPSSVAWDGAGPLALVLKGARSSWTANGKDVRSLPYGSMRSDRGDTYGLHANGLKAFAKHRDAAIPVGEIKGSILLVCGDLDAVWPACEMAGQIVAERARQGRRPPVLLRYPRAGHGVFGVPYPPADKGARMWGTMGGSAISNSDARRDGWPKVVGFLRQALAP
jgi:dienelactone hydrolase